VPYTVNLLPVAATHPITAGLKDFDLVTEQYWVLSDSYIDVLATTTQRVRDWDPWTRPVVSPAIWTRQWGRGRIFVATPGHNVGVLEDANVRTIIERGLLWAGR
jgi:type 1 glutamine amidotransferase